MKVNNNQNKISTQFSANVLQQQLLRNSSGLAKSSKMTLPSSSYKNDIVINPCKSSKKPSKISNSILSLYSPKQLLSMYSSPDYVDYLVSSNPKVKDILDSKGLGVNINPSNIRNIMNTHLTTTTAYALQIANKMGLSQLDKKDLEMACVFHDFGKVLIPEEIINKPEALTQKEKEIIDLHAELGYELLTNSGINNRVLSLIKNHHMPQGQNADVLSQILSVADIYSALREERSYKQELHEEDALYLLDQKALKGEVSTEVVEALKATVISAAGVA